MPEVLGRKSAWRYAALAIVVQVLWGLTPYFSARLIAVFPTTFYIACRFLVSGLAFAFVAWATKRWHVITWDAFWRTAVVGLVSYCLASQLLLKGLALGGVAHFGLISIGNVLVIATLAIIILHERVSRLMVFALLSACTGGALLVIGKSQMSAWQPALLSVVVIIAAFSCESTALIFSKRWQSSMPLPQYLSICQLTGGFASLLLYFVGGEVVVWPRAIEPYLMMAYVIFVSCGICYGVQYWLLRKMDGHRLALFDVFHAVTATVAGVIFAGETLTDAMILGGVFLFAAFWAASFSRRSDVA